MPCSSHFKVLILAFVALVRGGAAFPRQGLGSSQDLDRSLGSGLQRRTLQSHGCRTLTDHRRAVTTIPSTFDHNRGVEHDRCSGLRRDGDPHGPDPALGQIHGVHLPGSIGQMGRIARNFAACARRLEGRAERSLAGNSEKSSRNTRMAALAGPVRPGSMVTSAMASLVWIWTKAASGGTGVLVLWAWPLGDMVPSAPTNSNAHKPEPVSARLLRRKAAQRAGCGQSRRQMEPVGGSDADHGDEQSDLEQHQPAVIGRHQIARPAQQVPAIDDAARQQRADARHPEQRKSPGGGDRIAVPRPDRRTWRARASSMASAGRAPTQAPAASRCTMSDARWMSAGGAGCRPGMADQRDEARAGRRLRPIAAGAPPATASARRAGPRAPVVRSKPSRSGYR